MDRDIYHDGVLFGRGTLLASHRGLSHTARRFCASVSDVEVLTMVICGAFFKLRQDTELFASFRVYSRSFFPAFTDRTVCVRQAANLVRSGHWLMD